MAMVINLTLFNYLTLFHRIDGNSFSLNIFTQGNLDDNGFLRNIQLHEHQLRIARFLRPGSLTVAQITFPFIPLINTDRL